MKRTLIILLAASLCSFVAAQEGRILKNGPIAIQLNATPNVALQLRPKVHYLDEKNNIKEKPTEDMAITKEQLDFLAMNTSITRSIPIEWAAEMKKKNPNFKFMLYTASTYLKQEYWQNDMVEKEYMMHLAMCPAGVLKGAIDAKTTKFNVSHFDTGKSLEEYQEKNANIRSLSDIVPIYSSAVKDGWSKDQKDFLFFIRISDELMRVDEFDRKTGTVKVTRGLSGSKALSHKKGAVVTSPIYCAEKGSPLAKPKFPSKVGKTKDKVGRLAYCMDKGAANMPILKKKAQEIVEIMQAGYDGGSMDAMSAKLPAFNMVNALAMKTSVWNFATNKLYTVEEWVEGHDRMCGVIQRDVHAMLGRWPVVVANGISRSGFEEGEGDGGHCKRLLVPTELKPRPLESYNSEVGLRTAGNAFPFQLKMLQTAFQENLAVSMGLSSAAKALTQDMYDLSINYGGAFLYMAYEPRKEDWDPKKDGTGPVVRGTCMSPLFHLPSVGPEWKPEGGHSYKFGMPYIFNLPLGKPLESPTPGDLDALRYKDTNVFMRKYENGLVLVNPSYDDSRRRFKGQENRIDQDLEEGYEPYGSIGIPTAYTVKLDRRYIDPLTGDYVEGEVTLPPVSGKILLIEPSL